MTKLFANSGDPDQMPHSVASDLGLHCLPITILLVYQLQWVNSTEWAISADNNKLMIFFLFFLENRIWHSMQIVS